MSSSIEELNFSLPVLIPVDVVSALSRPCLHWLKPSFQPVGITMSRLMRSRVVSPWTGYQILDVFLWPTPKRHM